MSELPTINGRDELIQALTIINSADASNLSKENMYQQAATDPSNLAAVENLRKLVHSDFASLGKEEKNERSIMKEKIENAKEAALLKKLLLHSRWFEITVRAGNKLEKEQCLCAGDLLLKFPWAKLKTSPVTLNELTEILNQLGLPRETLLDPTTKDLYEKARAVNLFYDHKGNEHKGNEEE
jgi:hypothetical protein